MSSHAESALSSEFDQQTDYTPKTDIVKRQSDSQVFPTNKKFGQRQHTAKDLKKNLKVNAPSGESVDDWITGKTDLNVSRAGGDE